MYYPVGWPRILRLPPGDQDWPECEIRQVACNRDKILCAILTENSLQIWYVKPCVPIISHRRMPDSIAEIGENVHVQWKPDSSMICVVTSGGHLVIYHIVVPTDVKTLYEQVDPPTKNLRRESDELFMKEMIPPLIFSLAFEVEVEGGISDVVAIREELMVATKSGRILRFSWDGQEIRDYSLDLRRIPFCMDQQVLKAVPLADRGAFVSKIAYSPLLGGYAIVLNDGRAAFLVASNINFDPNSVTGIWAPDLDDATCVALNHKFKLLAFGRKNAQGIVYSIDEMTGGLAIMHRLVLRTRDFPGCPGSVTNLRWTPDGTAVAMTWALGGFSIWSTFGAMIMCSLCWDYGVNVSDPVSQNPLCLSSIDWSAEGYQLWMVNAKTRVKREEDPEFMPFPKEFEEKGKKDESVNPLANKALVLQFVKSPLSVNPGTSKQEHIYLQGEDRLYLNLGQTREFSGNQETIQIASGGYRNPAKVKGNISLSLMSSGSKQWTTINIPHTYMGNSWPIRFTSLDKDCQFLAVAGRTGLAHYSINQRKWRLFGNETQEKDFIVTGGLLWWKEYIIVGCYNLAALQDEVRIYSRNNKLDNAFGKIFKVQAQVLLLNLLNDDLVVFCADNQIDIYRLKVDSGGTPSIEQTRTFDANSLPGLTFHPACVILVALSNLRTETSRSGNRDSLSRDSPASTSSPNHPKGSEKLPPSIIMNICGRVLMIQSDSVRSAKGRESPQMTLPTVLASCCETIWFPKETNPEKPHLTASLWLYCGAHGMRVWLPVFPREGDHGHTFMSKRIMLHFPMYKLYPLAILFEDAIILGTENDSMLMKANDMAATNVPYSTLERTSLLFLHPILRQLIRRNLGYHAWEIARTCMMLPYFQHSLELLLHEVLEEEATSTEPIPDALLPSVVEFIQEFPVFHRTVGRCARKTEVALWPHLFAVVGSPKTLFTECMEMKDLDTAATYLIILQNLEPPAVAQNHATILLNAALDTGSWELAKELVRFLRTIDPDELEVSQRQIHVTAGGTQYGKTPQTPPINLSKAAQEEDISLLLGTLQVPRGRSTSISQHNVKNPLSPKGHKDVIRTQSESSAKAQGRTRKISSSSQREPGSQTAEEFFIDIILQRHARKLLTSTRIFDLGTFAAQLDFHLVTWLKKEANRTAKVDDFPAALRKIHSDFAWPYPVQLNSVYDGLVRRKLSQESSSSSSKHLSVPSSTSTPSIIDEKFKALKIDVDSASKADGHPSSLGAFSQMNSGISDSGYISHTNNENRYTNAPISENENDPHNTISEKTIQAMLKPLSFREDLSIMSDETSSLTSPEDFITSTGLNGPEWQSFQSHSNISTPRSQEQASKGPLKSEIQLRYLLQIMLEANCLEIAALISIVLKDALALIRIVNAARTSNDSLSCVRRLHSGLMSLETWAKNDCPGYIPFFQSIQPQIVSLHSFIGLQLQQSGSGSTASPGSSSTPVQQSTRKTSPHQFPNALTHKKISNSSIPEFGAKPKLVTKQNSMPSDITATEVSNTSSDNSRGNKSATAVPKSKKRLVLGEEKVHMIDRNDEDDEDTRSVSSVVSDILPEGQDEQAGCSVS